MQTELIEMANNDDIEGLLEYVQSLNEIDEEVIDNHQDVGLDYSEYNDLWTLEIVAGDYESNGREYPNHNSSQTVHYFMFNESNYRIISEVVTSQGPTGGHYSSCQCGYIYWDTGNTAGLCQYCYQTYEEQYA